MKHFQKKFKNPKTENILYLWGPSGPYPEGDQEVSSEEHIGDMNIFGRKIKIIGVTGPPASRVFQVEHEYNGQRRAIFRLDYEDYRQRPPVKGFHYHVWPNIKRHHDI
ncbi:hypothetical protein DENIS_1979 [Desulfonema ishimotonii]|uniref:Uncharacterized protein n=1 Tax=Desulfonema ishimotonii TaxID=45657 RepID=A0A401FVN5_9BACT|nr:hypothetical protein [Desulfonema ishimotonii]GBC61019.1 hypothetical protein DENIS_1979 [Desulfonema ishimotonii]